MARTTLSREAIVAAAFEVLDRAGLAGVTARAVAAELGVQAGAIYYHLPDMATVYDEMATEVTRRMMADRAALPSEWDALLRLYGSGMRGALLGLRDGGRLFAGRRLRDPSLRSGQEAALTVLTRAGLPLDDAEWTLEAVRDLTVGFVVEEQHRASEESGVYTPEGRRATVDATALPLTAAAGTPMFAPPDVRYAFALELLIGGVRERLRSG